MESRDWKDPVYKAWRLAVYRRDRFTCRMPGCSSKHRLNAHHIRRWADFPELRFVLGNGITLCRKCHRKVWGKEEDYESFFQSLLTQGDLRLRLLMLKHAQP